MRRADVNTSVWPGTVFSVLLLYHDFHNPLSDTWKDGSLPDIVKQTCGQWMGLLLMLATLVGNGGMYIAELMEDSYQLEGLAASDVIPKTTQLHWRHPVFGTPWLAILISLAFILLCVSFNFSQILAIDNSLSALAAFLE